MKAKLLFGERGTLGEILPQQGDWTTNTHVRNIQKLIVYRAEDIAAVGATFNKEGKLTWPLAKDTEKTAVEYQFDDMQTKIIRDMLEGLEKEKQLPATCNTLYEKFVLKR